DLFTGDEVGVARINDIHTTKHLTHNHFNVLVVDLHTLQAIDVLNLVNHVTGQFLNAFQAQNVVRIRRAINNQLTFVNHLAVVNQHLLLFGDQEFVADTVKVG